MTKAEYSVLHMESEGVKVKFGAEMKFVYQQHVVDDLKQLGFSIEMLRVEGGEMCLPQLQIHVDEQASLEAYWSAQAEEMRYKLGLLEDEFKYWYESKYYSSYKFIKEHFSKNPTQREVEARIMNKYGEDYKVKKDKIRKFEKKYRMLSNCCYASVVTKGKMLQTLRNIIQGTYLPQRLIGSEIEQIGKVDPTKLTAKE